MGNMGKNKRMQHTISHFYYAIIRSNQPTKTNKNNLPLQD